MSETPKQIHAHSIWKGSAGFVWAVAITVLLMTEALLFYSHTQTGVLKLWSLPALFMPLIVTLPLSVGINAYRRLTSLAAITNDGATISACSFYVGWVIFVANATIFSCIVKIIIAQHNLR